MNGVSSSHCLPSSLCGGGGDDGGGGDGSGGGGGRGDTVMMEKIQAAVGAPGRRFQYKPYCRV